MNESEAAPSSLELLDDASLDASDGAAFFQSILESLPCAVYSYLEHPSGKLVPRYFGRFTESLLDVTLAELHRDPSALWCRVHADDRTRVLRSLAEARARGGGVWSQEFRVERRHQSGEARVRAQAFLEPVAEGWAWTGMCIDTTLAHERAQDLHRWQRQRALAEFSTGIAHNFNNLLAVVIPNIQSVLENATGDDVECLEDAEDAAREAAELVRQLATLARPPTESASDVPGDLTQAALEAVALCRATFSRGIRLEAQLPERRTYVHAAAADLQQLVLNLCLNARDAIDGATGGIVEVRLTTSLDPDWAGNEQEHAAMTELVVKDNGGGMCSDTIQRLGEPFFTTRGALGAQGLGLATVFSTVHAAGGTIRCESSVGGGTMFVLTFPLASEAA